MFTLSPEVPDWHLLWLDMQTLHWLIVSALLYVAAPSEPKSVTSKQPGSLAKKGQLIQRRGCCAMMYWVSQGQSYRSSHRDLAWYQDSPYFTDDLSAPHMTRKNQPLLLTSLQETLTGFSIGLQSSSFLCCTNMENKPGHLYGGGVRYTHITWAARKTFLQAVIVCFALRHQGSVVVLKRDNPPTFCKWHVLTCLNFQLS